MADIYFHSTDGMGKTLRISANYGNMARAVGLQDVLFRPYRINKDYISVGYDQAHERVMDKKISVYGKNLIQHLKAGLKRIQKRSLELKAYEASNGTVTVKEFSALVAEYLDACQVYRETKIEVVRL